MVGRGYRNRKISSPVRRALNLKKKPNIVSSSDEDSSEGDQVPALPNFPRNPTRHDTRKKNKLQSSDSVESREGLSEAYSSDDSVNESLARARALLNDNNSNKGTSGGTAAGSQNDDPITENNCNWNTVEKKLDSCLRLLGKLVVDMTDLKQRNVPNNGDSGVNSAISEEVETYLKLNTRDAVSAFEEKLATSTVFENEFTRKVKQVGGANGKDFTERALAFIFTDSFAKDNTWEGKITKYKVNNLKVVAICEKIVLDKYPSFDKNEFSKAGTNWFRLGNQRAGSQPKQVMKKMALAQTNADSIE